MATQTLNPSPVKDGRRILGEKSGNAWMSPATRHLDSTSAKRASLFETDSPSKKLLPPPAFTSRKRSIDDVDGAQIANGGFPAQRVRPAYGQENNSTQSTIVDESQSLDRDAIDSSTRSQEQEQHRPGVAQGPSPSPGPVTVPEDPETRRVFIQEKATLLRTRIQSAMRNVRDHQLDRRISDLEAHSRNSPRIPVFASNLQCQLPESSAETRKFTFAAADTQTMLDDIRNQHGLSSPPLSAENSSQQDQMKTPTLADSGKIVARRPPVQLSSPPASVPDDDSATEKIATPASHRGDAVDGLLKLMNTGDR